MKEKTTGFTYQDGKLYGYVSEIGKEYFFAEMINQNGTFDTIVIFDDVHPVPIFVNWFCGAEFFWKGEERYLNYALEYIREHEKAIK